MDAARWRWRLVGLFLLLCCPLTEVGARTHPAAQAQPKPFRPAWSGIYPTVLTPWRPGGGVDQYALAAQLKYELRGGVHGLLLLGTIGEGQFATYAERAEVIKTAVACTNGCVPIVVGIHTCNLDIARAQIDQGDHLGADAVLVKYTGNWSACGAEVLAFFTELDAMKALPIFYYHYPSQTGLKLSPSEVAAILMLPGVVGIKESTLNLKEVDAHIDLTAGADKIFLSGTALNLTQFINLGGHGAMCAEGVLLPARTTKAFEACAAGDFYTARELQKELFVVTPVLRGGLGGPGLARFIMMTAQDHHLHLPMGSSQPQARLKAALNLLCVPTAPIVKCQYPDLSYRDLRTVQRTMAAIRCVAGADAPPPPPPETLLSPYGGSRGDLLPPR